MKTKLMTLLTLVFTLLIATQAFATGGEREGNGGDNVEPLFIQAKADATEIVNAITEENIDRLAINAPFKNWLKSGRLASLQFYVSAMELAFQEGPCGTVRNPRGTCFDNSDPDHPRMVISREYNRATTPEQAIALVIHEAGHFTGERDHLFLSTLGVELAQQRAVRPTVFTAITTLTSSGRSAEDRVITCNNAVTAAGQNARLACAEAGNLAARCALQTSVITRQEQVGVYPPHRGQWYCTARAVVHVIQ